MPPSHSQRPQGRPRRRLAFYSGMSFFPEVCQDTAEPQGGNPPKYAARVSTPERPSFFGRGESIDTIGGLQSAIARTRDVGYRRAGAGVWRS